MNDFLSRRSLLTGLGATAVYGSVASRTLAGEAAPAAPAAQEMIYSTMFMAGKGYKFDLKKYETKHLPLLKQSYGESVSRIEMRTANSTARGAPTDIRVTTAVYIADLQGFIKALQSTSAAITADLDSVATGPRNIQLDKIQVASGQPRAEVRQGHQVLSTYYKEKVGAKFDDKYYTDVYLPKLRSYYGDNAIRRIEFCTGMQQGGQNPYIIASTHIFVRDRDAYNTANNDGQKELMQIDDKYYPPTEQIWADSKITAIL